MVIACIHLTTYAFMCICDTKISHSFETTRLDPSEISQMNSTHQELSNKPSSGGCSQECQLRKGMGYELEIGLKILIK
jgi:hypothetical protein